MEKKSNLLWLFLSVIIIFLDQMSKHFLSYYLVFDKPVPLTSFFNLTLSFNSGAAFALLSSKTGWQVVFLSLVSAVVVIGLLVWMWRLPRRDYFMSAALSLVIGGAIGNLIDRVRLSYVVDFFDFHLGNWHFATFNVADSAICVGAALLIIKMFFAERSS